jgi:hypothetical protein
MRYVGLILILTGSAFSQSMTEFGAAAAVGTVAGANGKNVSDGLTAIFGKVSDQTVKAAGRESAPPTVAKLNTQPKIDAGVPLPPPPAGKRAAAPTMPVAQIVAPQEATQTFNLADVTPVLPPPPEMSPEKLKMVSTGMSRADLLKFGAPASKITMDEEGHALEIYSYRQNGQKIGTVRLHDGAVASVQ